MNGSLASASIADCCADNAEDGVKEEEEEEEKEEEEEEEEEKGGLTIEASVCENCCRKYVSGPSAQ